MKVNREEVARFLWTLGVALIIAGLVRYSIQGEWLILSKSLLIAGGVLIIAGIALGFRSILGYFSKRSSQLGTNTMVLSLAVILILAVVNFFGYRHAKRWDLTTEKLYSLSDQTRKIVGGLQKDVTIIRFGKEPKPQIDDLMAEYRTLSRHFTFQTVDPQQKPEIARQYGATRMDDVIVASGTRTEHTEPTSFRGDFSEEDITSAILKVTRDQLKVLCFTTNHGEKSLSDTGADGFSSVDSQLKKESYILKTVSLISEKSVPADCSVLVIPGPTQAFFPQEAEAVSKYLDGNGKVFVLIDPEKDPKLDALFQAWNVNVGKNLVVDASGAGSYFGTGPVFPIVGDYGPSPITKGFERTVTMFPLARTVSIADKSKTDPESIELLKTSARSFTIPGLKPGQKEIRYDPKEDTMGPLSLGVSASWKAQDKSERLVVIGNSGFASNQWIGQQRNGDLFFNAINWLSQDENLISIRPKTQTNRRINLTVGQASALKWLDLIFLPVLVIFAGVYIWWKRR
jgi:gliding motility-associatede transport system auxiliary component